MRFKKEDKEFVAAVTEWARQQGWQFHKVDLGKQGICFHCIGETCGVVMGQAGKRDKEALYNVSVQLHERFKEVMAFILPGDAVALGTDVTPRAIE